jgi:hypothetical protein
MVVAASRDEDGAWVASPMSSIRSVHSPWTVPIQRSATLRV